MWKKTNMTSVKLHVDYDELHAWCLWEESETEQWQDVTSKKSKLKTKKFAHESSLSVENNSCASPKNVIQVKDNWVDIRATMDTGAAGHVMRAEMFPRVKLDRTTKTKKFVAANEENEELGEQTTPFESRCRKVVEAGNVVVLDDYFPHIRNNRDSTINKLDVNSGVYTIDMWVCLDDTCPVFSWQGQ